MDYRPYHPDDFAQLYAIEEVCFQPPLRFPRFYMRRLLESSQTAAWVAEEEGRLAGFTIVEWNDEPGGFRIAYIQTIEVSPTHRRHGIGAELLRRAEEAARSAGAGLLWLHVESTNDAAIRLYRAHGFQRQGSEEHYYARHRNADIYAKPLTSAP